MSQQWEYENSKGRLIQHVGAADPMDRFYVVCQKHPEFNTEIKLSQLAYELAADKRIVLESVIEDGLKQCWFCREEKEKEEKRQKVAFKTTRFPEGAEL